MKIFKLCVLLFSLPVICLEKLDDLPLGFHELLADNDLQVGISQDSFSGDLNDYSIGYGLYVAMSKEFDDFHRRFEIEFKIGSEFEHGCFVAILNILMEI